MSARNSATAAAAPARPVEALFAPRSVAVLGASDDARKWGGRPRLDLDAAARALSALSHVAAAHPELAELEVNPLLVLPTGALALDARFVHKER